MKMCSEHDLINVSSALGQTGDQRVLSAPLTTLSSGLGFLKWRCLLYNLLVACSWQFPVWTACECVCIFWNCMALWGICASILYLRDMQSLCLRKIYNLILSILCIEIQLQSLYWEWKQYQEKHSGFQKPWGKYSSLSKRLVQLILVIWSKISDFLLHRGTREGSFP